jgi:hypothetical protein
VYHSRDAAACWNQSPRSELLGCGRYTARLPNIAAEFARLKVDVIVTAGTPSVIAAKQARSDVTPRWPMLDPLGFGPLRCTQRGLTRVHAKTRAANQMQILTPKPASHSTMLPVKTGPRRTRYPKAYVITGTASKAMIAHLL